MWDVLLELVRLILIYCDLRLLGVSVASGC